MRRSPFLYSQALCLRDQLPLLQWRSIMLRSSFRWLCGVKSPSNGRRRPAPFRPIFEALEERAVLSTYHVMNNADDGTGSLRAAIVAANAHLGADKIVFDASLSGQAIALTSGELLITDDLTINGLGASNLTVSGNNSSRVCEVAATANVTLSGLTITGGRAVSGGGILNYGTLTVRASTLSDNVAFFVGGGIANYG